TPSLNSTGSELVWASKSNDTKSMAGDASGWLLFHGLLDTNEVKVSILSSAALPGKPASITWDSKGERWLIVTKEGKLLWAKVQGQEIGISHVGRVRWGDAVVHPSAVSISPRDGRIVIS